MGAKPWYDWFFRWRRAWDSNPRTVFGRQTISSLLCNCDGGVRFGAVSVSPVPAESRLKSGFFARKALRDGLFLKVGSNRHFCRFWREIREDRREIGREGNTKFNTPQNRTSNRRNLFLRCYKWMYSPSTGTAFPRWWTRSNSSASATSANPRRCICSKAARCPASGRVKSLKRNNANYIPEIWSCYTKTHNYALNECYEKPRNSRLLFFYMRIVCSA